MSDGSVYAWVRVGSGDPEPAVITGEKPNRQAVTIGCPDSFDVDDPESGCAILLIVNANYQTVDTSYNDAILGTAREAALTSPLSPDRYPRYYEVNSEEAARREKAYQKAIKIKPHSYAGYGRARA